ncbi:MAG: response regulator [bacterium]
MTYRVLIADDEAPLRKQVARICSELGWEVDTAANGDEALEWMQRQSHQVFVFDRKMPGLSYLELIHRATELEKAPAILIITGYADVSSAVEAMKEGVLDFIEKPIDIENLKNILVQAAKYHDGCIRSLKAQQELDRSVRDIGKTNERFRAMLQLTHDAIFLLSARTGEIVDCNTTACEQLGYSRSDLLGKSLRDIEISTDCTSWEALLSRIRSKGSLVIEGTQRTKKSLECPVELSLSLICLASGEYITALARDITERKQMEEELQKRTRDLEERVKELRCLYGISKIAETHAISLDEIIQRIVDLIPSAFRYPKNICARVLIENRTFPTDNFRETVWKQVCDIIVGEDPIGTLEVYSLKEPGEKESQSFVCEEKDLLGVIAERLAKFIQQNRAESDLEQARNEASIEAAKLRSMVEGMGEGIVCANELDRITEANDWFLDFIRMPREVVLGSNLLAICSEAIPEDVHSIVEKFRTGEEVEKAVVNRNFMGREVTIRIQPVFHDSRYKGFILNVIDIGDVVEARKKAEETSQFKSEFLSRISYEMRTPLDGIMGMTGLLLETDLNDEQRLFLETVNDSALSLHSLVGDIQDLSKSQERILDIEPCDFDLRAVVEEALNDAQRKYEKEKFEFACHFEDDSHFLLQGHGDCLANVITIMLEDALKHCKGEEIVLYVSQSESAQNRIELECIVSGAPDKKSDDRNAGKRKNAERNQYPGDDIRTSLLRDLIEMLDGTVWMEDDEGDTPKLCLSVPFAVQPSDDERGKAPSGVAGEDGEKHCHVLLVDDSAVSRMITGRFIEKTGNRVTVAEDGESALKMLNSGPFDLIFMDVEMPLMDGFETTKRIRQDPSSKHIPVVALTAHAMESVRNQCIKAGMDDYISKPVSFEEIQKSIEKWGFRRAEKKSE